MSSKGIHQVCGRNSKNYPEPLGNVKSIEGIENLSQFLLDQDDNPYKHVHACSDSFVFHVQHLEYKTYIGGMSSTFLRAVAALRRLKKLVMKGPQPRDGSPFAWFDVSLEAILCIFRDCPSLRYVYLENFPRVSAELMNQVRMHRDAFCDRSI